MRKPGLIALLAAAILGSCATGRYEIQGYNFRGEAVSANQSFHGAFGLKGLLHQGLENIEAGGIFHPDFLKELGNVTFSIQRERGKSPFTGFYLPDETNPQIFKIIRGHRSDYLPLQILSDNIHEILHHYWERNMTEEKREEFRTKVLQSIRETESFMRAYDSGINVGGIPPFYWNLERFLSKDSTDYREHYGADFNEFFYGTEAYAYLMDSEIVSGAFLREEAERNEGNSDFKRMMREVAYKKSLELSGLTPELKEFYRDCIDDYYFQEYEEGRYWTPEPGTEVLNPESSRLIVR